VAAVAVDVVGKMARVTAEITPDHLGEVLIEVRAGTERFLACAADKDATIPKHTQVLVVASLGGRTVEVAPADTMRLPT
jgi:RNase P/RNase MRP subunit p29